MFPNNPYKNLKASDTDSSYPCTSPITGSNIPKWESILSCCYDCIKVNALYLESSEQIDCLFVAYLHKIKFYIF